MKEANWCIKGEVLIQERPCGLLFLYLDLGSIKSRQNMHHNAQPTRNNTIYGTRGCSLVRVEVISKEAGDVSDNFVEQRLSGPHVREIPSLEVKKVTITCMVCSQKFRDVVLG